MLDLCLRLKELETPKDPESLPVAQMKARRIIESFENPFRMVGGDTVSMVCVPLIPTPRIYLSVFAVTVFTLHRCARQQERQV